VCPGIFGLLHEQSDYIIAPEPAVTAGSNPVSSDYALPAPSSQSVLVNTQNTARFTCPEQSGIHFFRLCNSFPSLCHMHFYLYAWQSLAIQV
jgi:hypothetical protein